MFPTEKKRLKRAPRKHKEQIMIFPFDNLTFSDINILIMMVLTDIHFSQESYEIFTEKKKPLMDSGEKKVIN